MTGMDGWHAWTANSTYYLVTDGQTDDTLIFLGDTLQVSGIQDFYCQYKIGIVPQFGVSQINIEDSGALNIDLRGTRLWYNSYFILTMKVLIPGNLKGVPKKIRVSFWTQGSKIENSKVIPT